MASKVIALIAVVSLLAAIVQLPLSAAAATAAVSTAEHSQHHCCPNRQQTQSPAVTQVLPSLPCGADHSCCAVRSPAKLPSLPAGSNDKADGQVARRIEVSLRVPDATLVTSEAKSMLIRSPLDLSTVCRI